MITPTGQAMIEQLLSGEVSLLSDGIKIANASPASIDFTDDEADVTFGPAPSEWLVTAVEISRQKVAILTHLLDEPTTVLPGETFVLSLSLDVVAG